jgi:hypothetical protein
MMSPFKQSVGASKRHLIAGEDPPLSRFVNGQIITAQRLEEIPRAINHLETAIHFPQTLFHPFRTGSSVTAAELNQFVQPLIRLGHRLGVTTALTKYPLKPGDLVTAEILNEVVDAINALQRAFARH